jgi:hypothetical protein
LPFLGTLIALLLNTKEKRTGKLEL